MTLKDWVFSGAIVLLAIGAIALRPAPAPQPTPTQKEGSVSGPTLNSNGAGFTFDGVGEVYVRTGLNTASTTSCVIKTPAATSTLLSASAFVKTNQVAETVNWTTGTAMQASTTALNSNLALAAGAQGVFIASTTNADTTRVMNPNTWIQLNIFGGSGVASSTGICQAVFEIL